MSKEILELIENVDHRDTDALDEIDARVCLYLHYPDKSYRSHSRGPKQRGWQIVFLSDDGKKKCMNKDFPTRSRDALKAIRPEGWRFFVHNVYNHQRHLVYVCVVHNNISSIDGYQLPTEELAELHAIIQAIQWERDNNE